MEQSIITLSAEPVGQGRERSCYRHPDDPGKLIKIPNRGSEVQTRREIDFYRRLERRGGVDYSHIPRFYGSVDTNLGRGIVVDLVSDADGGISRSMRWYLNHGMPIQQFEPLLDELRRYLLDNLVIFNHDLVLGNLLLQRRAADASRLVIIDGLGDVVKIQWLNRLEAHARAKIERRWARFIRHVYRYPEVIQYLEKTD